MKYRVAIKEILLKVIEVEANTQDEAYNEAYDQYFEKGEIELSDKDFSEAVIEVLKD